MVCLPERTQEKRQNKVALVAGKYLQDNATVRVVRVEADRFALAPFKWTAPTAGSEFSGYGSMKPRRITGVNTTTGKARTAIVPDLTADVWTGVATTFTVEDSEGVEVVYNITSRRGELIHLSR